MTEGKLIYSHQPTPRKTERHRFINTLENNEKNEVTIQLSKHFFSKKDLRSVSVVLLKFISCRSFFYMTLLLDDPLQTDKNISLAYLCSFFLFDRDLRTGTSLDSECIW